MNKSIANVMPVAMGVLVSVINIVLAAVIKGMSEFLRPKAYTVGLVNIQRYVFLAQAVNMIFLPLLVTGNLKPILVSILSMGDDTGGFGKTYDSLFSSQNTNPRDLGKTWYAIVAIQILSNFFSNSVIPQLSSLVANKKRALKIKLKGKKMVLQEDLDRMYLKEEFNISEHQA